jgi:hypothetical protein
VGNNGETLVADSSTSTGLRYTENYAAGKNKIINGDFNVNQRGFTSSTTNATYNFDRFFQSNSGGTVTFSAETFALGAAPVAGYEGKNFLRIVSASQTSAGDYAALNYSIESVRTLAGQTATISFWAKASTGTPAIGTSILQAFGTGGSPSSNVITSASTTTITSSWARYSFTINLPSISGKTLGTNNNNKLQFNIWTSVGATQVGNGFPDVGLQNVTIDLWGIQIEEGSVATAFQTATGTIQGELAACQRYYLKSYNQATAPATASNTVGNTGYSAISSTNTHNRWNVRFPVNMRGTPTVTIYSTNSGTSAKIYNEQAAADVDGVTQFIGESGFHLYTSSGTPALGNQLLAHYQASAEL